jgi:hypothetical protein
MRRRGRWLAVAALCVAAIRIDGQGTDATGILAKAREALGGEKKLTGVQSFVITGQTRQIRGENLVPIEFEISVELPDKYARRDETPAVESGYSTSGFSGESLIQLPQPVAPAAMPQMAARPGGAPPPTPEQMATMIAAQRKQRVTTLKQDFTRWTLGMFAASMPVYPLTFTKVGIASSPQGNADVLDVKGPDGFAVRYFISQDTHLPVMLTWAPPARPAAPGRAGAPAAASAAPTEFRLYFADYRDVNGLMLPFRLRRATGADTTEETTVDRYRLNVKIDPRKFEVLK